jgi:ribosomal protein L32E
LKSFEDISKLVPEVQDAVEIADNVGLRLKNFEFQSEELKLPENLKLV